MATNKVIVCRHCGGSGKLKLTAVRVLRDRAKISQGEAAQKIGITQSAFSRIESGEVTPLYRVGKLADLFGVSSGVIMGFDPIPEPKPDRPAKAPGAKRLAASKRRRQAVARKNRKRA